MSDTLISTPSRRSARDITASDAPSGEKLSSPMALAVLLGAIVPVALWLRFIALGANSLDEDEIISTIISRMDPRALWFTITHAEANMAFYHVLLRLWAPFGNTEFAIRSLSVVAGVAAIPVVYALGARAFGRPASILAAALLAINGFDIEYSQDARGYSLLVLLVTLSSLFFLKALREGSAGTWIAWIVFSVLAIYAQFLGLFVIVAQGVFFLMLPRKQAPWRQFLASATAIGAFGLPMIFLVVFRRASEQGQWVPKTSIRGVYNLFACLAGKTHLEFLPRSGNMLLLLLYAVPVLISAWALIKARNRWAQHADTWHIAFLVTWLLVPIALAIAISVRRPVFVDRYLIICLPPFGLLAAYGFTRIRKSWLATGMLCLIAGLTAFGLRAYYRQPGQDWRGAAQYLLAGEKPGDAAVFFPFHYQTRVEYYMPGGADAPPIPMLIPSSEDSFEALLRSLPSQYRRVWFVGWDNPSPELDPKARVKWTQASLSQEFPGTRVEKRFDGGLNVVLYQK